MPVTHSHFYTIGHSTREIGEFLGILRENSIATLADIRRFPGSRRLPQFSRGALAASLEQAGISYIHIPELGGRRKPRPDSPNLWWRNESFRGYADHMASAEFRRGMETLMETGGPAAILCAEAVPWRCHRFLTSDELMRRGLTVTHLIGPGSSREHELNQAAVEVDGHLEYPAAQLPLA